MYENYGWKYVFTAFLAVCAALAWQFNGLSYGLDLSGGDEIIYKLEFGSDDEKSVKTTDDVVEVIRKRLDVLGIKELSIARLGNYQFVVQVPNASDLEVKKIRSQIERAGQLYFKMLADPEASGFTQTERAQLIETVRKQKRSGQWKENSRWDVAQWGEGARGQPGTFELLENATTTGKPLFVSGDLLANASRDQDQRGLPAVGFEWNAQGARQFYELTYNHKGRNLAVVLDGKLRSAPVIRSAIRRRGIIEGGDKGWDQKELTALIITLKAGSLPAKPVFAYRKHVGPQLGQAAVRIGKWSIGGALLIVVCFMLVYYNLKSGLIADIALALNLLLIIGVLALFKATLTLPGIAGILLTAGMAVDANILIFERIREEIARGSAVKQAIQAGYDRAFWTIFDANLTTALTALILMWVGTGPIKGFGLTLTIGIVSSMFTSLFVTRALYGFFVSKGILTEVKFRQLFKKPSIDFIGNWSKTLTLSLALIAAGWMVFVFRGDSKYGIDFTGGTAMQVRLKAPMEKNALEDAIEQHFRDQGMDLSKLQLDIQRVGPASASAPTWARAARRRAPSGSSARAWWVAAATPTTSRRCPAS
jgi:protein-export membrane protein SecD